MIEKPIIMSEDSVRAILNGSKVTTRRVIKPQPHAGVRQSPFVSSGLEDGHGREMRPRYWVGDLLYMKDPWRLGTAPNCPNGVAMLGEYPHSAVTIPHPDAPKGAQHMTLIWHTKSPMFMPKWAARPVRLQVTEVRAERFWDMTFADWKADFAPTDAEINQALASFTGAAFQREHMTRHWDALNAKRGFPAESNPWLWVYSFAVIRHAP